MSKEGQEHEAAQIKYKVARMSLKIKSLASSILVTMFHRVTKIDVRG